MRRNSRTEAGKPIPIIDWEDAALGIAFIQNCHFDGRCETIQADSAHRGQFAMKINDYSLCPRFYPGYVAVVDTTRQPTHDDYVLVRFPELGQCVLRRLYKQQEQLLLLAHAPGHDKIDLSEKNSEDFEIMGVIVNTIMNTMIGEHFHEHTIEFMPEVAAQTA